MTAPEHDPLDLNAQARSAAGQAEQERLAKEKEQNDLRWVMSSKQGRRFIHRQLSEAGVWRPTFSTNNSQMSFNEGFRNAGLKLMAEIEEACPERYLEMLAEQKEAKDKHDNRSADRRNKSH